MSTVDQRICGLFGIIGGLLLFAGDMLIYYLGDSTDLLLNMGNVSEQRILLSGLTALLAAWFYTLGLGQIHFAFSSSKKDLRRIVVLSFGAILVALSRSPSQALNQPPTAATRRRGNNKVIFRIQEEIIFSPARGAPGYISRGPY